MVVGAVVVDSVVEIVVVFIDTSVKEEFVGVAISVVALGVVLNDDCVVICELTVILSGTSVVVTFADGFDSKVIEVRVLVVFNDTMVVTVVLVCAAVVLMFVSIVAVVAFSVEMNV